METLLYKPAQVGEILNLGRSKVYELLQTRAIRSCRVGRAVRIPASALEEYVKSLEAEQNTGDTPAA